MKNKINLGTKFIAFLALFMFSILAINVSAKAGQMKMHAIYVDRGDAIVIESNGHFMLSLIHIDVYKRQDIKRSSGIPLRYLYPLVQHRLLTYLRCIILLMKFLQDLQSF